ncbi:sulfatase-like protein [Plasmopara halstedii]|uniref:Sulfatase-like protein n=1 Tax=Plasmopara halstedii TaxID=4781 RepID=A0A0P1AR57_PLAHL|nr:sulfatase-like protein [Plasmopara halstedii]CEG43721.1 sulfatase-like protein [Plasmopara halstedii]|eukprot:XP_024580090.1 sulfatase-like protein [Plasmopara halstedii]
MVTEHLDIRERSIKSSSSDDQKNISSPMVWMVLRVRIYALLLLCESMRYSQDIGNDVTFIAQLKPQMNSRIVRVVTYSATFTVSWSLFVAVVAPVAADLLLILNQQMRFTFELLGTAIRERRDLSQVPMSPEDLYRCYVVAAFLFINATIFALVRTMASWTDLSSWTPIHLMANPASGVTRNTTWNFINRSEYNEIPLEEGMISQDQNVGLMNKHPAHEMIQISAFLVCLVVVSIGLVVVCCECSPLMAFSALNVTLNELFGQALQPPQALSTFADANNRPLIENYIHPTEKYEVFGNDTLYRLTTGYRGELAFDVEISKDSPPNVLLISVESFRFRDSRYFVGQNDPSQLFKKTNLTVTPNFDRWAKRGVAIRNFWTSNPTSRSIESVLFGQIPYDNAVRTGLTDGKPGTKLSGLPQLFKAKGYETFFTTGSTIAHDNWDKFLPSHGFDSVWNYNHIKKLAKKNLNITSKDWKGNSHRGFHWGAHDDVSFKILGDLLVNKIATQKEREQKGNPKKPLFITHCTITTHWPFDSVPKWFTESKKPDFSSLYKGEKNSARLQRYLEARYFTDMELGKFLDRMDRKGILNDTIVVIYGDHGQSPENDIIYTDEEALTRVPGLILAEGRLGKYAGLKIEDVAEHYDILNTLADITGLPEGGFVQDGVGRSLKRKVPFGERVVFSNVPGHKMSVVRGNYRLSYDGITDAMFLHNTESDHSLSTNLVPDLLPEELADWKAWREKGRYISSYYKTRWEKNCLLAVDCDE